MGHPASRESRAPYRSTIDLCLVASGCTAGSNRVKKDPSSPAEKEARILELWETLRSARQELESLTGGQLEDGTARPGLSPEAQNRLVANEAALRELAQTQISILNALPAHIALLDGTGVIVAVNDSWRRFAAANVLQSSDYLVGRNYLDLCEGVRGEGAEEASLVASGIRRVLHGELPVYALEYPCHSPTEKRWFRLMATQLVEQAGAGAVVMHINVTERRQAEEIVQEKERNQRRLAEELAAVGSWETDLRTLEVRWTDQTFRIFETSRNRFSPTHEKFIKLVHPEDRQRVEEAFRQSIGLPGSFVSEHRILLPDGRIKYLEERWQIFYDDDGEPERASGTCQDITTRKLAEQHLARVSRLYLLLSRVNETIVRTGDREQLFASVCRIAVEEGGFRMAAMVAVNQNDGKVQALTQAGYEHGHLAETSAILGELCLGPGPMGSTLRTGRPGLCNDLATDPIMGAWQESARRQGYRSTASFPIRLDEQTVAAFVLFAAEKNYFQEDVVNLLVAVSEDISFAVEALLREVQRKRVEAALRQSEASMAAAQRIGHFGSWELDLANQKVDENPLRWSDEMFRIAGFEPGEIKVSNELFFGLVPVSEHEPIRQAVEAALAGRNEYSFVHRLVRRDGQMRLVQETAQIIFDESSGQPLKMVGTAHDITERKLAEDALRLAEAKYRSIFDNTLEGLFQSTPEGRYITINPALARIHGYESPEEMMRLCTDIATQVYVNPRDRDEFKRRLTEQGKTQNFEHQSYRKDRSIIWISLSARVIRNPVDCSLFYEGSIVDITDRKRSEGEILRASETLSGIVRIQNEMADADLALDRVFDLMSERSLGLTGGDGGVVELAEGEELVYQSGAGTCKAQAGGRMVRAGSFSGLAMSTGQVLCCSDTEGDARVDLATCRRLGVRSMIAAPFQVDNHYLGVLKVVSRSPCAFNQREVDNLQILARSLGNAIQRQNAAEALRSSAEEFRTLAEAMPQIVWMTGPDGLMSYLNRNWVSYTGASLEASLGAGWTRQLHPEEQAMAWETWQVAVATVGPYSLEARLRRYDGAYRWWLIRAAPLREESGKVLKWFGTCTDIHDLKRAELEITRTNRALQTLSNCNEALIHAEQEDELLVKVCQIAVSIGAYRMAWVGYAQEDDAQSIQAQACAGEDRGYLSEVRLSWSEALPEGRGPAGRTIRSGQVHICEDLESDSSFYYLEAARKRGYRSVICLPLREGNQTFGLLALYSAEVTQTGTEEIKLLRELADNLAFGILNLRTRAERRNLQEAVLSIARGVSASVGHEFFQSLNEHTVRALQADAGLIFLLDSPGSTAARTVSAIIDEGEVGNFDYSLRGTPGEAVISGKPVLIDRNLQRHFPGDTFLAEFHMEAYAGMPLLNSQGLTVGLIAVFFRQPLVHHEFVTSTLRIFAARAASEMERQQADGQVREQAALLDAAHEAILVKDLQDKIIYWNKGAERLYGWKAAEALGCQAETLMYRNPEKYEIARQKLFSEGKWEGEQEKLTRTGRTLMVQVSWTLIRDEFGNPKSVLAINSDLTEKKRLEAQFLRAQRMESIGTLAGGIAHDLNNILTPILMSVELLKHVATSDGDRALLATVKGSVERGADLVRQVLSYARGIDGQRVRVNLISLVRELVGILQGTFPKTITISFEPPDPPVVLWATSGDPTQIHQVVLNLCVNARDAMPEGGLLTLGLENVVLDQTYCEMFPETKPGPYVLIEVSDTGVGIPPELRERIFEPFFTTKETGKGTGLGLATTQGIVRSHGGLINLYSEPGKGTKFKVYLPADVSAGAVHEQLQEQSRLPRGKGEWILIVDDEQSIRSIARRTLERFGYQVLEASHGEEALSVYHQHGSRIALVLTDMAMPIMDGPALINALKAINPGLPIIGSSGFMQGIGNSGSIPGVELFVSKPYTAEALLKALHGVLHEPGRGSS